MSQHGALSQRRAELEREWTRWVPRRSAAAAEPDSGTVRREVAQSWQRCARTVSPDRDCAPGSDSDIGARWAQSPLRQPVAALADELRSIAEDAGYVAAVTDESGTILWSCGGRVMRHKAEQVNFAPGGRWDEEHMGTNALSLALRTGEPSTVFSAEHLVAALHGWVCYCAPIHAADGRRLGVLDLSTTWDRSHPLAMSTVRALATTLEARLPQHAARTGIRLDCLGGGRLSRDGVPVPVRPRQLEILALLALEPAGFTPQRLRAALYGDRPVTAATLKAEVSHLRRATGGDITSRRYALAHPVSCDAVDLLTALDAGNVAAAVRLYRGPLLPGSDTPGIIEWREFLHVGLRTAVLACDQPEHALRYGEHAPYDVAVHQHALDLLAPGDTRCAVAVARLHTALRAYCVD